MHLLGREATENAEMIIHNHDRTFAETGSGQAYGCKLKGREMLFSPGLLIGKRLRTAQLLGVRLAMDGGR